MILYSMNDVIITCSYFACKAKAMVPAARGADAQVSPDARSIVTCNRHLGHKLINGCVEYGGVVSSFAGSQG